MCSRAGASKSRWLGGGSSGGSGSWLQRKAGENLNLCPIVPSRKCDVMVSQVKQLAQPACSPLHQRDVPEGIHQQIGMQRGYVQRGVRLLVTAGARCRPLGRHLAADTGWERLHGQLTS